MVALSDKGKDVVSTLQVRIAVDGVLSDTTAESLGLTMELTAGGCELITAYVDQAQLTGLLIQLSDLHISYHRVELVDVEARLTLPD